MLFGFETVSTRPVFVPFNICSRLIVAFKDFIGFFTSLWFVCCWDTSYVYRSFTRPGVDFDWLTPIACVGTIRLPGTEIVDEPITMLLTLLVVLPVMLSWWGFYGVNCWFELLKGRLFNLFVKSEYLLLLSWRRLKHLNRVPALNKTPRRCLFDWV